MEIQNLQYGNEPEHILFTIGIIVIFLIFIVHWALIFNKINKTSGQTNPTTFEKLRVSFFRPMTAIYTISIIACIALFQNVMHNYEIEHKYLSIQKRHIFFTVENYPEGERRAQDDFSSTLFVQKFKAEHDTKKNNCIVQFIFPNYSNALSFSNKSIKGCKKIAKSLQKTVNLSREKDFPKIKPIAPVELEFVSK